MFGNALLLCTAGGGTSLSPEQLISELKAEVASKSLKPTGSNLRARCQYIAIIFEGDITTPDLSRFESVIDNIELGFWGPNWNKPLASKNFSFAAGNADFIKAVNGGLFQNVSLTGAGCPGDTVGPADKEDYPTAAAMFLTLSDGTKLTLPPSA